VYSVEALRKIPFDSNTNDFHFDTEILASTGNIGFAANRLMLLFGQFNYGKSGILDITHTRLFTFGSFRRLFDQAGFRVREARGIPAPFGLVFGNLRVSRAAAALNEALIAISGGLFSYQIFFVLEPLPSLESLLGDAHAESTRRIESAAKRMPQEETTSAG